MVSIGQQNLHAQFFQHILRNALDRSECPNRHKHRRLNLSVRSDQFARAGRAARGFNLQAKRQEGIVTWNERYSSPDLAGGLPRSPSYWPAPMSSVGRPLCSSVVKRVVAAEK